MAHYAPRLQVKIKCNTAYTGQRNHERSETTRYPNSNQPIVTGLHRYYLYQYTGLQKTQKTTVLLTYKGSNTTDKTVLPRNRKEKYFLLVWALYPSNKRRTIRNKITILQSLTIVSVPALLVSTIESRKEHASSALTLLV